MLEKIIKTANTINIGDKEHVFEIGSNSDLILENTITNNLVWTIKNFAKSPHGFLTFPTKFDMIEPILNLPGKEKIIVRVSMNPNEIINKVEFGTSKLRNRIIAINKLKENDYKTGILIAPVIFVNNWKSLYHNLIVTLSNELSDDAKNDLSIEIIFMTYSFIHKAINEEAFPNAISLYDKEKMTMRGRGLYAYKSTLKDDAKTFFYNEISKYLPEAKILYIV